jgi:hypothetical protein
MIKIYKDNAANAIFIEDANGVQFLNSLQAVVESSLVSIIDLARDFEIVSGVAHTDFVDENGDVYPGDANAVCDELNAIFTGSGSTGQTPNITSSATASIVEGESLNYELTADYGVGYEWTNLPAGVTTADGNLRRLIGGSSLSAGTYVITAKAINYFGEDTLAITLTVSDPPFSNTKSVEFQNNDYCGANAALLDSVLGRSGNGSGSGDAWTIAHFFKPGSANNASQTIFYFGAQDVANNGQLQIKYNGSLKRVELRYGSNNNRLNLVTANDSLTVGQWSHIMVTYDGGTTGAASGSINDYYGRFSIYIDGVLQSTTNSNSNYGFTGSISGQNLRIGRWNSGQNLRNSCKVDEVAVWDSDQSANIADIYNSGTPHDLADLTTPPDHWWRMGDGDTFPYLLDSGDTGGCIFVMLNMSASSIVSDVPS